MCDLIVLTLITAALTWLCLQLRPTAITLPVCCEALYMYENNGKRFKVKKVLFERNRITLELFITNNTPNTMDRLRVTTPVFRVVRPLSVHICSGDSASISYSLDVDMDKWVCECGTANNPESLWCQICGLNRKGQP